MDRATQVRIVREQQAGHEQLARFEQAEARRSTFPERLDGFRRIMGFSRYLPREVCREDDDTVTERWTRLRERYEARIS